MRGSMPPRRPLVRFLALVSFGLVVAACGGSDESPEPRPTTSPSTSTPTTTMIVPPTTFPADQRDALIEAVIRHQRGLGVERLRFVVRNLLQSSADPEWARFNTAPTPGNERVFFPGFGVAHFDGSAWTVVDYGMDTVGCPPAEVPEAVRATLQLAC